VLDQYYCSQRQEDHNSLQKVDSIGTGLALSALLLLAQGATSLHPPPNLLRLGSRLEFGSGAVATRYEPRRQPATDEELRLVRSVLDCGWRLNRVMQLESGIYLNRLKNLKNQPLASNCNPQMGSIFQMAQTRRQPRKINYARGNSAFPLGSAHCGG
jgi:hypothetical protein